MALCRLSAEPWREALSGTSARERALALFALTRIWDTEHNNGVLVYLLLADRDVEILADRGVDRLVGACAWEMICREMEAQFRQENFESGVLLGIDRIHTLLAQYFPAQGGDNPNELPDPPVTLGKR